MKRTLALTLLVGCSWAFAQNPVAEPPELGRLRGQHEARLQALDRLIHKERDQLKARYLAALSRISEQAQANAELDDLLALREASNTFQAAGDLKASELAKRPPALRRLQEDYLARKAGLQKARDRRVMPLNKDYLLALDTLVRTLTRASRLDEGLVVSHARKAYASTALLAVETAPKPIRKPLAMTGTAPKDGLVAYHDFEDEQDESGLKNHGRKHGASSRPGGVRGRGLALNGSGDWFELSKEAVNGARSFSFWMRPGKDYDQDGQGDYVSLITRDTHSEHQEWSIAFNPRQAAQAGSLLFLRRIGHRMHVVYSDVRHWRRQTWYHIACVIDEKAGMRLYIDGKLQTSTDPSTAAVETAREVNAVGRHGQRDMRYFEGMVDELRIYHTALSEQAVRSLFLLR